MRLREKLAIWVMCGFTAVAMFGIRSEEPIHLGLAAAVVMFGPVFFIGEVIAVTAHLLPDDPNPCLFNCGYRR